VKRLQQDKANPIAGLSSAKYLKATADASEDNLE